MHFSPSLKLLVVAIVAVAPLLCQADDTGSDLRLQGFGTIGLARSSSDQAEYVRDLSQPRGITHHWSSRIDTVLGMQANWQASQALELVGQVVSRYRYDGSRDPELMWAFAKWDPDARVSLRAGRIGADFMMAADSRLVGYSYLAARPSSDFFGPLFFSYFDGADASVTHPLGAGLVRGKVFAGATPEKTSGTPGIWSTDGSRVDGAVLDYSLGHWMFRANVARIRFSSNINFPALVAPALTTQGKYARFRSLGITYDQGPLQVQAMFNAIDQESVVFENSHGAFLLAGYRFGTLTPYIGISRWDSQAKPSSGNPILDGIKARSAAEQTTYTLGTRWDVMTNLAVKAQWDSVRGTPGSTFPVQQSQAGWNGRTQVLSLIVDFVF